MDEAEGFGVLVAGAAAELEGFDELVLADDLEVEEVLV